MIAALPFGLVVVSLLGASPLALSGDTSSMPAPHGARRPAAPARLGSPYEVRLDISLPLSAGALAMAGLLEGAIKPALGSVANCRQMDGSRRCSGRGLGPWDRASLGWRSAAWARSSDILQGALPALALLSVLGDAWWQAGPGPQRLVPALLDATVALEATSLAVLTTSVIKFAVRRPRPTQYSTEPLGSVDGNLSFPSGHTTVAAASLTAAAATLALRPHPRWLTAVGIGVAAVGTAAIGTGRILGGRHFVTDVVAGAVVGATAGTVVPWLHRRTWQLAPEVGTDGGWRLSAVRAL